MILGKAKIISYEDLKKAQAKCTVKEKATAAKGKGKRSYKHKSPVLDTKAEAETNLQEEKAGSSVPKNKMVWIGEVEPTGAL